MDALTASSDTAKTAAHRVDRIRQMLVRAYEELIDAGATDADLLGEIESTAGVLRNAWGLRRAR